MHDIEHSSPALADVLAIDVCTVSPDGPDLLRVRCSCSQLDRTVGTGVRAGEIIRAHLDGHAGLSAVRNAGGS